MNGSRSNAMNGATAVLAISGMTCDGCAKTVTRILSRVRGVRSAQVDLASGRAVVIGATRPQDLLAAVEAAGYGALLTTSETRKGERDERRGCGCC